MTKYEKLLVKAEELGIKVREVDFETNKKCGYYSNNKILINNRLKEKEKFDVLVEELGHHYKTFGDITDQSKLENRKQEIIARRWGYEKLVGIIDLINAYNLGVRNRYELSEFLNVTEVFIDETIDYYRAKYGTCYQIDNYIVYFYPNLGVLEML